jgi:hypothetical protein
MTRRIITAQDARSAHVADFRARYAHAGTRLALPAADGTRGGNAGD